MALVIEAGRDIRLDNNVAFVGASHDNGHSITRLECNRKISYIALVYNPIGRYSIVKSSSMFAFTIGILDAYYE